MIMWLQRNCTLLRVFFVCYFLQIFIVLKAHEREDEWFFFNDFIHSFIVFIISPDWSRAGEWTLVRMSKLTRLSLSKIVIELNWRCVFEVKHDACRRYRKRTHTIIHIYALRAPRICVCTSIHIYGVCVVCVVNTIGKCATPQLSSACVCAICDHNTAHLFAVALARLCSARACYWWSSSSSVAHMAKQERCRRQSQPKSLHRLHTHFETSKLCLADSFSCIT